MRCLVIMLLISFTITGYVQARGLRLEITPQRQEMEQWIDARFDVRVIPVDGFTAPVYLHVSAPTLPWNQVQAPDATIKSPYEDTYQIVVAAAAYSQGGEHQIIVEASNGAVIERDTCILALPQWPKWRRLTSANSPLTDAGIVDMKFDKAGDLWVSQHINTISGSSSRLVRIGKDGSNDTLTTSSMNPVVGSIGDPFISDFEFIDDALWVSWGTSISRYQDGKWSTYNYTNAPIPLMSASKLLFDRMGNLWLSGSKRLVRFDYKTRTSHVYTVGLTGEEFLPPTFGPALFDDQNRLWGYSSGALMVFEDGIWNEVTKSELGIPSDATVINLTTDNDGVLTALYTVDSRSGGIIKLREDGWHHELTIPSYDYPMYRVAVPFYDSHGGVWLPTGKVVTHFDGKRWEYFHTYNSGFPDDMAGTIIFGPNNSVWIATDYSGIAVYTPDASSSTDHDKATVGIAQRISVVPNPVTNDVFTLSIPIERGCRVHVSIVDPLGHTVKSVADVIQPAGSYAIHVDAMNLAAGLYFVRVEKGDVIESLPVMVTR